MTRSGIRPLATATLQTRLPAAAACLLALLLLWEALPASPALTPAATADRRIATPADNTAALAAGWTTAVLDRPLFRPGRRPPAALAAASIDPTPPRLSAIIITATGRSAIFITADGTASVLGVGGHSGAFQVQNITPDSARLSGPDGSLTLHPAFAGAAADASVATPPPTPPHAQRNRFDESDQ